MKLQKQQTNYTAHIGIKVNEEAKKAIDMPIITTARLPYTDYCQIIKKAKLQIAKEVKKTVLANYTTSNHTLKSEKVLTTDEGNMRLVE